MSRAKRINIFAKAYDALMAIDDDKALKKAKLTLAEYDTVYCIMKELSRIDDKVTGTVSQAVADWFTKYGFTVKVKGIGWEVSI